MAISKQVQLAPNGFLNQSEFEKITAAASDTYEEAITQIPLDERPVDIHLAQNESNQAVNVVAFYAAGNAIYVLPDELTGEFYRSDCSEVFLKDLAWPFKSYYLSFAPPEPLALEENTYVDGCYIVNQSDEILVVLTSRRAGIDYEKSNCLITQDSTFSLHLPTTQTDVTVDRAVQLGIAAFYRENAPPAEDRSYTQIDASGVERVFVDYRRESRAKRIQKFEGQRAAFESALNIIFNAACFITGYPEEVEDQWDTDVPPDVIAAVEKQPVSRREKDRQANALRKIVEQGYTKVKVCGRRIVESLRADINPEKEHVTVRPHWRRGHWRRHRHGPSLMLIKLLWVRPLIVNSAKEPPLTGHEYIVESPK